MREIDVAGRGPIFDTREGHVCSYPKEGFSGLQVIKICESVFLEGLARALRERDKLESAIANMRALLPEFNVMRNPDDEMIIFDTVKEK